MQTENKQILPHADLNKSPSTNLIILLFNGIVAGKKYSTKLLYPPP